MRSVIIMKIINLSEIEGMRIPTGRHARVLIGADRLIQAEHFTMGYVKIDPEGSVPKNEHEQEEVYYIIEGNGTIELGGEVSKIEAGSAVYIPSNIPHELVNTGTAEMVM